MRQSEYKKRYDPEAGQYVKEPIYGERIFYSIKSVERKISGKTAEKASSKAVFKMSEHAGEKAEDNIIEFLHKRKQYKTPSMPTLPTIEENKPLTDHEISERVNQLLSGGKLRRVKFIQSNIIAENAKF